MARKLKEEPPRFVPLQTVLARHLQDPGFRSGFEKRRLIHEIAVAVRNMREDAGLTQARLASLIGTSQPTIARLERGIDQRTPRWDVLQKIAFAVGKQMKIVFLPASSTQSLVEIANGDHGASHDTAPASESEDDAPASPGR